jgi:phage-related minor tail protein
MSLPLPNPIKIRSIISEQKTCHLPIVSSFQARRVQNAQKQAVWKIMEHAKVSITNQESLVGIATSENMAKSKLNPILTAFPAPFLVFWARFRQA